MFCRRINLNCLNIVRSSLHNHKIFRRSSKISSNNMDTEIVWIDLEMTGLDIEKDKIIEVACLVTDANLQIMSTNFHTTIHESDASLNAMDDWCLENHAKSGLIDAVRESKVTLAEAEEQLLGFIKKWVKKEKTCPLAGNSVYMDRLFIRKYMPRVDDYLHYRIIDVSSIKELAKRWYPNSVNEKDSKIRKHRALQDIEDSIEELNYYRQTVFK